MHNTSGGSVCVCAHVGTNVPARVLLISNCKGKFKYLHNVVCCVCCVCVPSVLWSPPPPTCPLPHNQTLSQVYLDSQQYSNENYNTRVCCVLCWQTHCAHTQILESHAMRVNFINVDCSHLLYGYLFGL